MDFIVASGFEEHLFWHNELSGRKIPWKQFRRERGISILRNIGVRDLGRMSGICAYVGDVSAHCDGTPLDSLAEGQLMWHTRNNADIPQVTAVNVVAIGIKKNGFLVGGEGPLFYFTVSRR